MDVVEEHVMEETDPYPNGGGVRISVDRGEHWKEVEKEYNEVRSKVHALMWVFVLKIRRI